MAQVEVEAMTVYSFYIFDRHTECIYHKSWLPTIINNGDASSRSRGGRLSAADDAKLIFGTIFSLRNMVRKLGGPEDSFISYRTGQYKLHYYETPTNLKFVMLTDTKTNNLRIVLHQIYVNLYVEYVVKNPLSPVEHPGGVGVANELFELALDSFITGGL
ncbi:MAG: TRAPP subunit bet5 [Thelocarpon superellum]|nr:MAG: TRAPP subunit bet5 [Thelocarpon superellum]